MGTKTLPEPTFCKTSRSTNTCKPASRIIPGTADKNSVLSVASRRLNEGPISVNTIPSEVNFGNRLACGNSSVIDHGEFLARTRDAPSKNPETSSTISHRSSIDGPSPHVSG